MSKSSHSSHFSGDEKGRTRHSVPRTHPTSDKGEHSKTTTFSFPSTLEEFTRATPKDFHGHRAKVQTLGWNMEGSRLASGSMDHSLRIWSLSRMSMICELKGHTGSIDKLAWDPQNPDILATASTDKTIRIWDSRMSKSAQVITTPGENINLSWHPNKPTIAVGTKQDLLAFVDIQNAKIERKIQYPYEINELRWDTVGKLFFITTGLGHVNISDYPALKPIHTIQAHMANCYSIDIDAKNRFGATGGADGLIALWDLEDWICIRTWDQPEWSVRTLSFSYDGNYVASGSEDLFIDISDVIIGESVHRIKCTAATTVVTWHPKLYLLAYACDESDKNGKDEGNFRILGSLNP